MMMITILSNLLLNIPMNGLFELMKVRFRRSVVLIAPGPFVSGDDVADLVAKELGLENRRKVRTFIDLFFSSSSLSFA